MPSLADVVTKNDCAQSRAPPRYQPERGFGCRTVQQSSPGSDNLVGRSEMTVVLQTLLDVADDGVVQVVA